MPPALAARASRMPRSAVLLGSLLLAACDAANQGEPPPVDELFFPSGLLLDRRTPASGDLDEPRRWLFVANGNNDLSFNSGTVLAIDLDAFFSAWAADPATMAVDPYC